MSDRDDIDQLIETVNAIRGGLEILKELVDADRAENEAGLLEANQNTQILIDEIKALTKRVQDLEDGK